MAARPETRDPADEAMLARAHERFSGERRRFRRRAKGGELPNLIVIGGLKCGTTSVHHYLQAHPEIEMSRPKELNFFVSELNWGLGPDWYASHWQEGRSVRGETSPHYTNFPFLQGVPERIADTLGDDAKLIYMVRDPIQRLLSHFNHNVGGGYETRPFDEAIASPGSAYVTRGLYATQLEPYAKSFGLDRILVVSSEELSSARDETMRRVFDFAGVESGFTSEEFDRQWETGSAKSGGGFRLMDRAVRLPGLRAFDRNFDRLPESLRWRVERIVHDPEGGPAPKPELTTAQRARCAETFRPDVGKLEATVGRTFGWFQ